MNRLHLAKLRLEAALTSEALCCLVKLQMKNFALALIEELWLKLLSFFDCCKFFTDDWPRFLTMTPLSIATVNEIEIENDY